MGPRFSKVSHLSDPPAMRHTFWSPNDPSAAMRLCAEVDLESSMNSTPFLVVTASSRCASPEIFFRYSRVRFEQIFIALVTRVAERIFIALCTPENLVSERRYFFLLEITIFSQSVLSLESLSFPNIRTFGILFEILRPNSFARANTCSLIQEVPVVCSKRRIFASK